MHVGPNFQRVEVNALRARHNIQRGLRPREMSIFGTKEFKPVRSIKARQRGVVLLW